MTPSPLRCSKARQLTPNFPSGGAFPSLIITSRLKKKANIIQRAFEEIKQLTTPTSVRSLTGVNKVGLRVQQDLQRFHVVVEILEHGGAFAQDAVSREERSLLLQQQGHVVVRVARREQHSDEKR